MNRCPARYGKASCDQPNGHSGPHSTRRGSTYETSQRMVYWRDDDPPRICKCCGQIKPRGTE